MSEREPRHVQIRDVPADAVDMLQARAGKAGMSLTSYLRNALVDMASRPSMEEWAEEATDRDWGVDRDTIRDALDDLRREADHR
ncbi:MAG: hypothetical protein HOY78_25335 [Saccharothrix sp.]|nr:hypothetical protein [Saccharothrix sp.]